MDIQLSKEEHIAIRYAIMHAHRGKVDPGVEDYVVQRAAYCSVCGGEGTPYGIECTQLHETDPGQHVFHHVCSNCFSQLVVCTDYVTFSITNIGFMDTSSGKMEYHCTVSQYADATEYHVEGQPCDKDVFLNYVARIRERALANREKSIADSQKYFDMDVHSPIQSNLPHN